MLRSSHRWLRTLRLGEVLRGLNPGNLAPESTSTPVAVLRGGKQEDTCSLLTNYQPLRDLKMIFFSSPRKALQAPLLFLISCVFTYESEMGTWVRAGISLSYTTKIGSRLAGAPFPHRVNTRSLLLEGLQFGGAGQESTWPCLQRARLLREDPTQQGPQSQEQNGVPPAGSSPRSFQAGIETREPNQSWRSYPKPGGPWKPNKMNQTTLLSLRRSVKLLTVFPEHELTQKDC